ncbi:MAG: DUF805 domain-containing protein [Gammaproteobacteria bacterium]
MPMTFLDAIKICVAKYADFNGRASRSEYWWFLLAVLIGSAAASSVSPALCALFSVATFLPMIAVGARRLHDTNRSGWWQLLALVPFAAIVVFILLALPGSTSASSQQSESFANRGH